MNSRPLVSIVVLNWNGWRDTVRCLESLFHCSYPNFEIIVVDNGSIDRSVEMIRRYCAGELEVDSSRIGSASFCNPIRTIEYSSEQAEAGGLPAEEGALSGIKGCRKLKLILNRENSGFAEGNNIAIRYVLHSTKSKYVLLINNDVITDRLFLECLVDALEAHPGVGFVGPKIYYDSFNGRTDVISSAGGKTVLWKGRTYHLGGGEVDRGQHDKADYVDYVEGSCLLVRTEMIERIGLLDSQFFTYWEEVDWSIRGRRAGYRSFFVPQAKVWHKVQSSSTGSSSSYFMTRNMFWCVKKHATNIQMFSFVFYFFCFSFWIRSFVALLIHRNQREAISLVRGVIDGMKRFAVRGEIMQPPRSAS